MIHDNIVDNKEKTRNDINHTIHVHHSSSPLHCSPARRFFFFTILGILLLVTIIWTQPGKKLLDQSKEQQEVSILDSQREEDTTSTRSRLTGQDVASFIEENLFVDFEKEEFQNSTSAAGLASWKKNRNHAAKK